MLCNRLHALDMMANLVSIGRMVSSSLGVNFEEDVVTILAEPCDQKVPHLGSPICHRLFFLDIDFVLPDVAVGTGVLQVEPHPVEDGGIAAFTKVKVSPDL